MNFTLAGITFDQVVYDEDGDVLYLHVGDPSTAVDFDESPEGHAIRFDAQGNVVGITLVRPRHLMELGEPVVVTIPTPERITVDAVALHSVLHAA
jgi:uncharacterized protein YuzE